MKDYKDIILFGSGSCHKTQFYKEYFEKNGISYHFKDVSLDPEAAEELRSLYENRRLNFPTLLIHGKKLRNPRIIEIEKVLNSLDQIK